MRRDAAAEPAAHRPYAQDVEEVEVVDAEALTGPTVHAPVGTRGSRALATARGAAVVASTGFVAGAVATALLARRGATARRRPARGRAHEVLGTRSFLVDVHLLGDR